MKSKYIKYWHAFQSPIPDADLFFVSLLTLVLHFFPHNICQFLAPVAEKERHCQTRMTPAAFTSGALWTLEVESPFLSLLSFCLFFCLNKSTSVKF